MPPPARIRYNVKARAFKPGPSRKRRKLDARETGDDSNREMIKPEEERLRMARKVELLDELKQGIENKVSSKKRKRMEKYIDKKLRLEERKELIAKLVETQKETDSLSLQSTAMLGTGKTMSHNQILAKQEDRIVRRLMDSHPDVKYTEICGAEEFDGEMEPENSGQPVELDEIGSALRRDTLGAVVFSTTKKRKRRIGSKKWNLPKTATVPSDSDSTASDSTDSENGASEHEVDSPQTELSNGGIVHGSEVSVLEIRTQATSSSSRKSFKEWARAQVDNILLHNSSDTTPAEEAIDQRLDTSPEGPVTRSTLPPSSHTLPSSLKGPLGEHISLPSNDFSSRIIALLSSCPLIPPLPRKPDIQAARLLLPILAEEQQITETILLNPVVCIQGETGSGKTSQIVQFLYERGWGRSTIGGDTSLGFEGLIGITQPRRVAAMSMAVRVSEELEPLKSSTSFPPAVAYQIRHNATVSNDTRIKFMTEGILLREMASDLLLRKYGVIVLDEVHERSLCIDVLVGSLSRVVKLRQEMWRQDEEESGWKVTPLRLVLMSATLTTSGASILNNPRLFSPAPPIISIPTRQYPITIHFSRTTFPDYLEDAFKKTVKIHRRLPPGGILVFLTGQREIESFCKRLNSLGRKNDGHSSAGPSKERISHLFTKHVDAEVEEIELGNVEIAFEDSIEEKLVDTDDLESEGEEMEVAKRSEEVEAPVHVLPLYSLLSPEKQMKVFQEPPIGSRLIVVATNIAETSITIPGIRYVVDCGRAKERHYDTSTGIQSFPVTWVSKTSAQQRAGRAGRTGPGHVYRLYSSAVFENYFPATLEPEILRMPIEGIVLTMKAMGLDSVVNFPFPTQPDKEKLKQAEISLRYLGALDEAGLITDIGKTMSLFPLSPRFAKMLVMGQQHGCLPYVIAIVSALSVGDPFIPEDSLFPGSEGKKTGVSGETNPSTVSRRRAYFSVMNKHSSLGNGTSDAFKYLSVCGAYGYAGGGRDFCEEQFVKPKAMDEIHKLRGQIHDIVNTNFQMEQTRVLPTLSPPNTFQIKVLRQLLVSGLIDQVAVRKDLVHKSQSKGTQFTNCRNVPYRALGISEDVFIHPSSVVHGMSPPEYCAYLDIVRTSKPYLKCITILNPSWLPILGPSLCTFSNIKIPSGKYPIGSNTTGQVAVIPHFGPEGWELPAMKHPNRTTPLMA